MTAVVQPNRHEQLMLLEDGGRVDGRMDVSFLHRSFCIAGLPLRRPKDTMQAFSRHDGRFAYTVNPHSMVLPDGQVVEIGVPYGPKARLLAMWLATEVKSPHRRTGDRWIEIGAITEWLRSIGISPYGTTAGKQGSIEVTKDQLVRLAFAQFTMVMKNEDDKHLFKRQQLIESGIFDEGQLEMYARGQVRKMKWPQGVQLTEAAYDRFLKYSVPVPTARLAKIANSAMAIDIFVFLCYTLPLIQPGDEDLVSWRNLIAQFGNHEAPSKFRETFKKSIENALAAYPEANVALVEEGLRLRYSDPAVLRKAFITLNGGNRRGGARRK